MESRQVLKMSRHAEASRDVSVYAEGHGLNEAQSRTVRTGWQKLSAISIFRLNPLHMPTSRHIMNA